MSGKTGSCCQAKQDSAPATSTATPTPATATPNAKVFVPQVDILESENQILLLADLPGVDEQGLEVTLEKNVLTLRGKVQSQGPEGYQLAYSEYEVGNFERAFTVSNDIDRQGIEAVIKDGVLRLTLPKAKHAVLQKIAVKTA